MHNNMIKAKIITQEDAKNMGLTTGGGAGRMNLNNKVFIASGKKNSKIADEIVEYDIKKKTKKIIYSNKKSYEK